MLLQTSNDGLHFFLQLSDSQLKILSLLRNGAFLFLHFALLFEERLMLFEKLIYSIAFT